MIYPITVCTQKFKTPTIIGVIYFIFQIKSSGLECGVSDQNINLSLLMYTSYFVLFARFFYNNYLAVEPPKQKKLEPSSSEIIVKKKK